LEMATVVSMVHCQVVVAFQYAAVGVRSAAPRTWAFNDPPVK
jgi:hypothetical protein